MTVLPIVQLQVVLLIAFVGLVSAGAVIDMRSRHIPDRISLAVALVWVMYVLTDNTGWQSGLIAAAIVFAIGFVLFERGFVGGGDVKLLTVVSLWASTELVLPMTLIIAIAGVFVSVAVWIHVRGLDFFSLGWRPQKTGDQAERLYAPYAVAILMGAIFVAGTKAVNLLHALEPAL